MDDDNSVTFTWTGSKRTWTEQEWNNYRNAPWWLQRMLDVASAIASLVNRAQKRGVNETRRDEQSPR